MMMMVMMMVMMAIMMTVMMIRDLHLATRKARSRAQLLGLNGVGSGSAKVVAVVISKECSSTIVVSQVPHTRQLLLVPCLPPL